jgi:hypothetical protein
MGETWPRRVAELHRAHMISTHTDQCQDMLKSTHRKMLSV